MRLDYTYPEIFVKLRGEGGEFLFLSFPRNLSSRKRGAGIYVFISFLDFCHRSNGKQEGRKRKGSGVLPRLASPVGSRFFQSWDDDCGRGFQVFPEGIR